MTIASISSKQLTASGISQSVSLGANVSLSYYDFNNPIYLDTIVQSNYTDTFGSNLNNITIDGGAFYDTYSREKWKKLSDTDAVLVHTDYPIVGDYFNDDELVEIEE